MLAWHVLFDDNSIYSQRGRETCTYINGGHFFDWQFPICHIYNEQHISWKIVTNICIFERKYRMPGSFEIETDQTNAFLAWEYRVYGTVHRIPSLIFTQKMSGFHAILNDHFSTLTFCTFSNSKMNVFGDSDFFVQLQKDTYFPYIYLTFLKPVYTYRIYWKKAYISGFWNFPATSKNTGRSVSKWVPPFWSYSIPFGLSADVNALIN